MKKFPSKETVLRVRQGHPWIYRSELSRLPEDLLPGEPVEWVDSKGRFVGIGYCNPKSVITGRLFSQEQEKIDPSFFEKRIIAALSFRKRFYPNEEAYRVVNGEADFLPGLVIDRYGENIVVQILTAGMEWHTEAIVAAIESVFSPKAIIARNDPSSRTLEGLPVEKKILSGSFAPPVVMIKNGLSFEVDLLEGQKTGFFLDQSENYLSLKGLVSGGAVLDAFCYTGGWSLHAARFGAKSVIGIDASEGAIDLARRNAARNQLESLCRFEVGNVFDLLKGYEESGQRFDCIILDPPSFVKRRKEIENAVRGYKEIHLRAMKLLRPGGFLVTCSCSYHLSSARFREIWIDAARDVRRSLRLLDVRFQAKDHPVLLSLPETEYLKCALLQVL